MGTYSFNHDCSCCSITLLSVTGADAQAWKNDANNQGGHSSKCPTCGCQFVTEDDGVAVGSGGGVQTKNVSMPRIDSLGATASGTLAGGTTVRVNGHAFNVATPTVKFDGVAGTGLAVVNDSALDVNTPAGQLKLNIVEGPYQKLQHGTVSGGPFTVGETITGATSAETAVVEEVGADFLLVSSVSGAFTASETLDGASSLASASYTSIGDLDFSVSESVTGVTSGAQGTLQSISPFKVSGVSGGPFTDGEDITGGTTGALAKLDTPGSTGDVDVTVENSNGQRLTGGALAAAFEYTA